MAARSYFDHDSPEGQTPAGRARAAGYPSAMVGENIAAGKATPQQTMEQWMLSPRHCANIMNARYQRLGVGYAFGRGSKYSHYWVQVFGG